MATVASTVPSVSSANHVHISRGSRFCSRLRAVAQVNSPAMKNVVKTSASSTPWPVRIV